MPFAMGGGEASAAATAARRPRILVTAELDAASLDRLRALGDVEVASYREKRRLLKGEALVEALVGVEIFVTEVDVVDAASIAALPDLRVIATCRGDAVNVDADACRAWGIPLLHAPGRNADAVADLTLAFALMHARKLASATTFLRTGDIEAGDLGAMGRAFATLRGRELWRKTIGIVGFGAVGRRVARRFAACGARVLASDPFVTAESAARDDARLVPLAQLLAESDFVSLHAAVTDETRGLIGEAELRAMPPHACLINTARAALVDEAALLAALASGQIAGAALDTFPVEPPGSDDPLLALDRVLVTPHVGGNTADVAAHQGAIVAADLEALLAGEAPRHALDAEVAAAFRLDAPRPEPTDAERVALGAGAAPAVTDLERDAAHRR